MRIIYILLKQNILNLKILVTAHHSHHIWIDVGDTYLQFFLSSKIPSFRETLGGTLKNVP